MLKMINISKEFPGVKALDNVSIEVQRGEIRALVGENGAGKSTLIKILSGALTLDSGELYIDGEKITNTEPSKMIEKGVAVIYQELMLIPHFTVAENIFHGRMPTNKFGKIDYKKMEADAQEILDRLQLSIVNPSDYIKDLSVAKRQMVEIAKALSKNAKIIVLDEPTAVLAESELQGLFKLVRQLSEEGIVFIYISHRLQEIFDLCHTVTVMKDGRVVDTGLVKDYTIEMLIHQMVGRDMQDIYPKRTSKIGEPVLKVKGLTRAHVLNDISFDLRKGEIFGLAGLAGAGRTEILRSIIGADPYDSGDIELFGRSVKFHNVKDALRAGLGIVPEERKTQGLLLKQNMVFNLTIPALHMYCNNFKKLNIKKETQCTQKYIDMFHIRPGNCTTVALNMSGGNQQKLVLSKWIAANCKILLIDEPTRGVDVGAKREIYDIINSLIEKGLSVLVVSSELPELIGICDRIGVMNHGCLTAILNKDDFSEENIMTYAAMDIN